MIEYTEVLSFIRNANHIFWAVSLNRAIGKLNNRWYTNRLEVVNVKISFLYLCAQSPQHSEISSTSTCPKDVEVKAAANVEAKNIDFMDVTFF